MTLPIYTSANIAESTPTMMTDAVGHKEVVGVPVREGEGAASSKDDAKSNNEKSKRSDSRDDCASTCTILFAKHEIAGKSFERPI